MKNSNNQSVDSPLAVFTRALTVVVIGLGILYLFVVSGGFVIYFFLGDEALRFYLVLLGILGVGLAVAGFVAIGARIATSAGRTTADAVARHDLIDAYGDVGRLQASMMGPMSQMHRTEQLTGAQIAKMVLSEARQMPVPMAEAPALGGDYDLVETPKPSGKIRY